MRTFRSGTLALLFALLISIGASSVSNAAPATDPEGTGFLTLYNKGTGQHILAYCEDNNIEGVFFVVDDRTVEVKAPIGASCAPNFFPGFEVVFNLDPRDGGWVIHPTGYLGEGSETAYACTSDGAAFVTKTNSEGLRDFSRPGDCSPGTVPG